MLPALAVIDATQHNVPQMRNDAGTDKKLSFGIIINAPRIAETVGYHFKFIFGGVIAPYAAVDVHAVAVQNIFGKSVFVFINSAFAFGFSHFGGRSKSLTTVEPTVWPPVKTVERFVAVADAPTREPHFDVGRVGHVVVVAVGNEKQVGWCAQKQTVKTHGHGSRESNSFQKHLFAVGHAVVVGVFQNQNSAVARIRKTVSPRLVVTVFGHPEPPTVVPTKSHGLGQHRLGSPSVYLKTIFEGHVGHGLFGRQKFGIAAFLLGNAPQRIHHVLAAEFAPRFVERYVV